MMQTINLVKVVLERSTKVIDKKMIAKVGIPKNFMQLKK